MANKRLYLENHWGFSEETMEVQMATYDIGVKCGFLEKTSY